MTTADRRPRYVPPATALLPTREQLAIQTSVAPTLLIEARAGAAKTTTLALRLAEAWSRGAAAADCLVLTYTDAACQAYRQALITIGVPAQAVQQFRIATFEDFAATVLQQHEGTARVPRLSRAEDLQAAVRDAVRAVAEHGQDHDPWADHLEYPSEGDQGFVADYLDAMLRLKGTLRLRRDPHEGRLSPDDALEMGQRYMTLRTFLAYERLRAGGHPDHPGFRGPSDATYDLACLLLDAREQGVDPGAAGWPQRLRVLLVDEMHDMNEAMYTVLLHLLAGRGTFFTGVGDADQVIHAAAGADAGFMRERIASDTRRTPVVLPLAASYRFGAALAGPAGRFIGKPVETGGDRVTQVEVSRYADDGDCAAQVLAAVRKWRKTGRNAAGQAVLLRHEHQSTAIENVLIDAGIAYRTVGLESYLLRPEVLLVRGLLAIVTRDFASLQGRDTLARLVQAFVLFCGTRFDEDPDRPEVTQADLTAEALRDFAGSAENLPLFLANHVLRKAAPAAARRLRAAVEVAGGPGDAGLFDRFLDALDMPWFIAQALVRPERRLGAQRNLDGLRRLARGFADHRKFFGRLNEVAIRQAGMRRSAAVTVASAAFVKGLEFDEVLLPFLAQGEFPFRAGDPSDEANLFYVAITRARQALRLFAPLERPSEFIARAGLAGG